MSLNDDFQMQMKKKVEEIEAVLQEYLPRQKGYQSVIMEAMGYSLLAGGKRLRTDADVGDLSSVWRYIKGNPTVYGGA